MAGLYGDGINSLAGVFSTAFADMTREDIEVLFAEAVATERCVLPRGPNRFCYEVQPKRIRGFNEIVSHSWLIAVCTAVLGADY